MIIYVSLNIISNLYSKDIKSPFRVKDLTEYSLLTFSKYILPLFGVNKQNSTPEATIQNRINELHKNKFIERTPRECCYLTQKGEKEAIRVYEEFIKYFSEVDIWISNIENKYINSEIDNFDDFFINIDNAYKMLVKFELISLETAEKNLKILNERKSIAKSSKNDEVESIIQKREELINNNLPLLERLGYSKKQALKMATKNRTTS
jgi:hypothetical protein